ncbi:MAG: cation:proton antiporter [Prevotella sp.]|nr:cation:proton antiporter [Prevotella sp.]MCM1074643.1 cation:proton antiporter [Ruminococcus sp.]
MKRATAFITYLPAIAGFTASAHGESTSAAHSAQTASIEPAEPHNADSEVHSTNGLIADLALILLLGAVVTILFKKMKQPVVLGYILAGFLASPKFEYIPSISNLENIDFWAELGIVILMFTLGLEFSFKKLINSGTSAILTAFIIITGMTFCGFGVGQLLDFNFTNSIFLGGMLSMSSTTIILKAFTDLGLKQKKFASLVLAVLIIEDLFAVLMLVLLSSLAVGDVQGAELAMSIGKLLFYLILWYVVGVWFIPTFFDKFRRYMNSETLLVVSMGICFGMAILSTLCGFSLELGSFIAGSIIAGTVMAERIEHVVQPVKDLFGAVFFISVGMMVEPAVIAEYWSTILILAVVVIAGMIIFGTTGMLITGQTLKVAMESGFSLTQIGEFSFIIASLGMSLGVLNESLYPIIVAVSVITIFTTPYFIKLSSPAYKFTEKHLPGGLRFLITRYNEQRSDSSEIGRLWRSILLRYVWRIVLFSVMIIAVIMLSRLFLFPLLEGIDKEWGHLIATVITLAAMSPFLVMLSFSATKPKERERLNHSSQIPFIAMRIIRYLIGINFVIYFISMTYATRVALVVGASFLVFYIIMASSKLHLRYARMEKKFLGNLNEREDTRTGRNNVVTGDLHLAFIDVDSATPFVGDRIEDSGIRRDYGVSISSIQRGMRSIPLPGKDTRILPGDILGIIGTDESIQRFNADIEKYKKAEAELPASNTRTELQSIILSPQSLLIDKTLAQGDIRRDYHAMLLRVIRDDGGEIPLTPDLKFAVGDTLWLVGDPDYINKLK